MPTQQEHIVSSYDDELDRLKGEIVRIGDLAVEQLQQAVIALKNGDRALAERVIKADDRIDEMELEISSDVLRVLALRHPMASDLRGVLASLRIASDIERIGDYATNIAKRTLAISDGAVKSAVASVEEMSDYAIGMMRAVRQAYIDHDAEAAMRVRDSDVDLDRRYTRLFRELLTYMLEDPRNITNCAHLLFVAKNVERIGDHVTNIAENICFSVEGTLPEEERAKGDTTSTGA
jgi:phosphate transport system protein